MASQGEHLIDQQAQNAEHYLRVLHELIDLGTDLARLVHQQAHDQAAQSPAASPETNADAPAPTPDPTVAFDRIARCIRRTICLARKLSEPLPAHTAPDPNARKAARKRIIRAVEDNIQSRARPDDAERLHAEFLERLDDPELEDDITSRPIDDIIREICSDLGIAHYAMSRPVKRRTPAEVAALAARAAKPSPAASAASNVVAMRQTQPNAGTKTTDPPK